LSVRIVNLALRMMRSRRFDVSVILGGLSSSYFHEELIICPQVDFVLREGTPLGRIPNVTRKEGGQARINPHNCPRLVFKPDCGRVHCQGLRLECVTCGGSHTTCTHLTKRQRPVFRSPASLIVNEIIIEQFGVPPAGFLHEIDRCERLFQLGDKRLSCYISPIGLFLDPGSPGFEEPERFGYRLFARTLEEHRQLLVQPNWERILNYETKLMTRRELVDATCDAAQRLNELKIRHHRIPRRRGREVAANIAAARALRGEIARSSMSTVCEKRELFWRGGWSQFRMMKVVRIVRRALST
jgi:hypothetical protein